MAEQQMKRTALNRKNSLFVGNVRSGETAAFLSASQAPAADTASTRRFTSHNC